MALWQRTITQHLGSDAQIYNKNSETRDQLHGINQIKFKTTGFFATGKYTQSTRDELTFNLCTCPRSEFY